MAMRASEAVALLQSMFENWDRESLIVMLQTNHGHVEHTIEMILKMENDTSAEGTTSSISTDSSSSSSSSSSIGNAGAGSSNSGTSGDTTLHPSNSPDLLSFPNTNEERNDGDDLDLALARQMSLGDGNDDDDMVAVEIPDEAVGTRGEVSSEAIMRALQASKSTSGGRGTPVDLPNDYLRPSYLRAMGLCGGVTAGEVAAGRATRREVPGLQDDYTVSDAQLAELMQNELFRQQLRGDATFSSLFGLSSAGLNSMLGAPYPAGASQSAAARQDRSYTGPAGFGGYTGNGQATTRAPRGSSVSSAPHPSSSATNSTSLFSTSSSASTSSKWSSYLSSMGEEARRKMNEVAVKFQAATGSGGYAAVDDEEGTSCAIEEDDDEEGGLAMRSTTLSRRGGAGSSAGAVGDVGASNATSSQDAYGQGRSGNASASARGGGGKGGNGSTIPDIFSDFEANRTKKD